MKLKLKLKQVVVALSAAGVMLSAAAQAAPRYSVTDLEALMPSGSDQSFAKAINDSGQVVGTWEEGLGSGIGGSSRAFLYSNGAITDLGTLGGNYGDAHGINANGQVVGSSTTTAGNNTTHAFLYSGGAMTSLGTFGGRSSGATAINANGQVVGFSTTAGNNNHAFLYSGGAMTDLGTFGGSSSIATAINANGQIVGWFTTTAGNDHAFLYSGGAMTDLGTLGDMVNSAADDINDLGQILITSWDGDSTDRNPFLYSDGVMTDLHSLIDPQSGWRISGATGINNLGQIVGYGFNINSTSAGFRALLLSPVPEPEIYLMMLAGLGLLGAVVRRHNKILR